jgi:hypothetical protein
MSSVHHGVWVAGMIPALHTSSAILPGVRILGGAGMYRSSSPASGYGGMLCVPPVEVHEPRGLSVLWYSLLVVGMRILPHLAPGGPPQRVGCGCT